MKPNESTSLETVREIFLRALEKPSPAERKAFLDGACGTNPDLRARVNELLENHLQDSFLEQSPIDNEVTLSEPTLLKETEGTQIGRYKLLQKIGEGGMGIVYMAEQEKPVKRKVALKIIKLGMDTKHVVARFEAERQALAMMDHPNIARVHDGGATESGRPYFVMELVKGVPITEFCDKNKLTARERLELFTKVCYAIQSAHHKGIIHRDVKPNNVLVTHHHGEPMPKIIDFGIAKATNQKLTEKTLFTNYAQLIGTPAYMSPEQAEMSTMDVDARTDIYSLGVLLYELLTGTTPFPEKELLSKGYGEMQRIITEQEPDRPSLRMSTLVGEQQTIVAQNRAGDAPLLTRQLRGDLDWIVMKSLEKDRTRRYETANGLGEDIRRHLKNEPVLAAKPTFRYQLAKLYHRNKPAFAAAAGITLAMVIGTVAATAQALTAAKARDAERDARSLAEKARIAAELAEMNEKELRERAQSEATRSLKLAEQQRLNAYVADMKNADNLIQENDFITARKILQQHRPVSEHETDLRGFEWRYLWEASHEQTLRKAPYFGPARNSDPNSEITLSNDQTRLVIRAGRRRMLVLNAETFDMIADIETESDHRIHAVFSPDDTRLYTFVNTEPVAIPRPPQAPLKGHRMALHIYETTHWKVVARIDNAYPPLNLSPEGDPVFARYQDHERAGEYALHPEVGPIQGSAKRMVAIQEDSGNYEVSEICQNMPTARRFPSPSQPVPGIALHRHWSRDDAWSLWDLSGAGGAKLLHRFPLTTASPMAMVSPDGQLFAMLERRDSFKRQRRIRVFNCRSGAEIPLDLPTPAIADSIRAMAFDPTSTLLLAGGNEQQVHVWNVKTGEHLGAMPGHPMPIDAIAVAGENVIIHYASGAVAAWNLEAALAPQVPWQSVPTLAAGLDTDTALHDPEQHLLDQLHPRFRELMTSGQLSWRLPKALLHPGSESRKAEVRISPSGRFLATTEVDFATSEKEQFGSVDKEHPKVSYRFDDLQPHERRPKEWSSEPLSGEHEKPNPLSSAGEMSAIFVSDYHVLLESTTGVELWDLVERQRFPLGIQTPLKQNTARRGSPPIAALHGPLLAIAPAQSPIVLWNYRENREIAKLPFGGWLKQLRFTPEGDVLFISGQGKWVSGIEIATGVQRHRLPGHRGPTAVNFSPDGRTILTVDNSGIRFWNQATGREMTRIGLKNLPFAAIDNRWSVGFTSDGQSLVCDDFDTGLSKNKLMMLTPRSLQEIDAEIEAELVQEH